MANEIKCIVGKLKLSWRNKEIDGTQVSRQIVYDKDISLVYDKYAESTGIYFENCIMNAIPSSESIKKFIPNLTVLTICNSSLSKITSEDLEGFSCLKDLYVVDCKIESLPSSLFKHTPNLEIVSFQGNMIREIGGKILSPLLSLKIFSLENNVNINVLYDVRNSKFTLQHLITEISTKCKRTLEFWKSDNKLCSEFGILKKSYASQSMEMAELKAKYEFLEKKFETLILSRRQESNFTIKINSKHFSTDKAVLRSHSQVLDKFIAENPDASGLELKDISEATFKEILIFMNEGSLSNSDVNMVELLEASFRLEIKALTTIVVDRLKEEVNQVNALDVLGLCNKYDNYDELKMKVFGELQKKFRSLK